MGDDEAADPKPKRRDKAALPFAEDAEQLDGRAWNRKPLVVLGVVLALIAIAVIIFLALQNVTSDDDGDDVNVPPPRITTTSVAPTTTSTTTTTTSTTAPAPPTTIPSSSCSPEEGQPDCIDPDGDGFYDLIIGGAQCMATAEVP